MVPSSPQYGNRDVTAVILDGQTPSGEYRIRYAQKHYDASFQLFDFFVDMCLTRAPGFKMIYRPSNDPDLNREKQTVHRLRKAMNRVIGPGIGDFLIVTVPRMGRFTIRRGIAITATSAFYQLPESIVSKTDKESIRSLTRR